MPRRPISREYPITAKKSGRNTARSKKAAPAPKRKAAPKSKATAPPKRTAYEKRLRDYQRSHPGWRSDPHWKQKARGHKEAEHVERARKLRDRVDAFAMEQAQRFPGDQIAHATRMARMLWEQIKLHGESRLKQIQNVVALLEREREARPKDERGRPQGLDWGSRRVPWINMTALADEYALPREIFGYH